MDYLWNVWFSLRFVALGFCSLFWRSRECLIAGLAEAGVPRPAVFTHCPAVPNPKLFGRTSQRMSWPETKWNSSRCSNVTILLPTILRCRFLLMKLCANLAIIANATKTSLLKSFQSSGLNLALESPHVTRHIGTFIRLRSDRALILFSATTPPKQKRQPYSVLRRHIFLPPQVRISTIRTLKNQLRGLWIKLKSQPSSYLPPRLLIGLTSSLSWSGIIK
jgi:hypothetical protein